MTRNLQDMFDNSNIHCFEKKAPRSAEHNQKLADARKKIIYTPLGIFYGFDDCCRAYGFTSPFSIRYRMKKWPDQYYFLDKECQE